MWWGTFILIWTAASFPLGMLTGRWLRTRTLECRAISDGDQ